MVGDRVYLDTAGNVCTLSVLSGSHLLHWVRVPVPTSDLERDVKLRDLGAILPGPGYLRSGPWEDQGGGRLAARVRPLQAGETVALDTVNGAPFTITLTPVGGGARYWLVVIFDGDGSARHVHRWPAYRVGQDADTVMTYARGWLAGWRDRDREA